MAPGLSIKNKNIGMIVLATSVSAVGVVLTMQDYIEVDDKSFRHPFFQTFLMFIGESLGIFVYLGKKWYLIKEYGSVEASPGYQIATQMNLRFNPSPLLFAIPMLTDVILSTNLYISIKFIPTSISQMICNLDVFLLAILSVVMNNFKLYRHHILGLIMQLLSIIVIGVISLSSDEIIHKGDHAYIGVISALICAIFSVIGAAFEERILKKYYINPFLAVGYEGILGLPLVSIMLLIFQYIPGDDPICNNGKIENSQVAFVQISKSPLLILLIISFLPLTILYNGMRLIIGKNDSALSALTLTKTRAVTVWILYVVYPFNGFQRFNGIQIAGLFFLLFGSFIFNEVLVLPILGLSKYTKKNILKRKLTERTYEDFQEENKLNTTLLPETQHLLPT